VLPGTGIQCPACSPSSPYRPRFSIIRRARGADGRDPRTPAARAGKNDAAAAVLDDLDAFVALVYRMAWTTLEFYRDIGDRGMVVDALKRAQTLRGERDPGMEPVI
jgi:hypothetical protein